MEFTERDCCEFILQPLPQPVGYAQFDSSRPNIKLEKPVVPEQAVGAPHPAIDFMVETDDSPVGQALAEVAVNEISV